MYKNYRAFLCERFQFHKGAIRTSAKINVEVFAENFNSIKVRLER